VLVFEHLVFSIKGAVAYLIPDVPTHIFMKLQRDRYLARKARLEFMLTERQSSVIDAATGVGNRPTTTANGVRRRIVHQSVDDAQVAYQPGSPDEAGVASDRRFDSDTLSSKSSFHSVDHQQSSSGRASPLIVDDDE